MTTLNNRLNKASNSLQPGGQQTNIVNNQLEQLNIEEKKLKENEIQLDKAFDEANKYFVRIKNFGKVTELLQQIKDLLESKSFGPTSQPPPPGVPPPPPPPTSKYIRPTKEKEKEKPKIASQKEKEVVQVAEEFIRKKIKTWRHTPYEYNKMRADVSETIQLLQNMYIKPQIITWLKANYIKNKQNLYQKLRREKLYTIEQAEKIFYNAFNKKFIKKSITNYDKTTKEAIALLKSEYNMIKKDIKQQTREWIKQYYEKLAPEKSMLVYNPDFKALYNLKTNLLEYNKEVKETNLKQFKNEYFKNAIEKMENIEERVNKGKNFFDSEEMEELFQYHRALNSNYKLNRNKFYKEKYGIKD